MLKNSLLGKVVSLNCRYVSIYHHKTHEIVSLIEPEKCNLIITMNITIPLLRKVADKNKTVVYFVSASNDINNIVKERYFVASVHLKLYRTDTKVIFSTANLSLSNWDEISIIFPRSPELDRFISGVIRDLKKTHNFLRMFH